MEKHLQETGPLGPSPVRSARARRLFAALFATSLLALPLVGCGDDDDDHDSDGHSHEHDAATEKDASADKDASHDHEPSDPSTSQDAALGAQDGAVEAGSTPPDGGAPDSATPQDAGSTPADATVSIDPPQVNGCTNYVDRTTGNRTIVWDFDIGNKPERCIKIKRGQTVLFDGDVQEHPIDELGGSSPSPFAGSQSTAEDFVFPNAGGFGFYCTAHPEMNGAIWVVD